MNWRLRRVRLEAVGPADARYDDITLSFAGSDGHAAANGVVLLRNGGGKSLLLYLLFKALLPRKTDGTKTAEHQRLSRPVVMADECATVAVEWEHRDDGRLLVTGHSFERGEGEQSRWMFEPVDGVLSLDDLPLREGTRRRTRAGLMAALHDHGRRDSRLRFRPVDGVEAWERELDAAGIDPQILRYQARLNRSEGGEDNELRFKTPEAFVRFVLQMVLDEERLSSLQQGVHKHAAQLAQRDALAVEAQFCRDAAARLAELAGAHAQTQTTAAAQAITEQTLTELAGILDAALGACDARRLELERLRDPLEQRRRDLETRERDLRREGNVVRARTDELLARHAAHVHAQAGERERGAAREAEAFRLVDALLALALADGEVEQLRADVERQDAGIRSAREARAAAAAALASALLHAAGELDDEAESVAAQLARTEQQQVLLRDAIDDLGRRQGDARQRRGALDAELAAFERATERLRADGVLGARERPSTAAERLRLVRDERASRREALREQIDSEQRRRGELIATRDEAHAAAEEHRALAEQIAGERERAAGRIGATLTEPVQDALDIEAGYEPLDEPADSRRAIERARAAADARKAAACNEIEALARDERSLTADGLLAVEPDVERLCEELDRLGVQGFPALRYLGQAAPRQQWQAIIASHPAMVAGIVLLDASPQQALDALAQAGVRAPRRPVVLAGAQALMGDPAGVAQAVIMPASAAFDARAGDAALEVVGAALATLGGRRDAEQSLSAALGRAALTVTDHADLLRELLPETERSDRQLLGAVERERSRHEHLAAGFTRTVEQEQQAIGTVDELLCTLEQDDEGLARELAACERGLERLEGVDDVDVAARRAELARVDELLQALSTDTDRARVQRDAVIRDARGIEERLAATRARAADLRTQASALPVEAEPAVIAGPLAKLRQRFDIAEDLLSGRISDQDLRARLAAAESAAGRLRGDVDRAEAMARVRALELAGSALGVDEVARAQARRDAHAGYEQALRQGGVAKLARGQAEERARVSAEAVSAEDYARQPKILNSLQPADAGEGERLQARIDELKIQRDIDADDNRREREELDHRLAAEQELRSELDGCRARVSATAEPFTDDLPAWTRSRQSIFDRTSQASKLLADAAARHNAARDRLRVELEHVTDLVAGADERVPKGVTAVLKTGEALAADAARLDAQLRTRAGEVDRMLSELDRHRRAIIGQLAAIASDSVRKLQRVAAATTLPREDALGAWAGKQFARVQHKVISDDAAREKQLGRVLDKAVGGQSRRRGLDLAFDATLALCEDAIDISVLKPHPQPDGEYHSIEVVGPEFSGGEELTVKLILFCAVAAVRAAERSGRARRGRRTGPLLIDNPIGTASRESLVDLQLRLARHLDAQFIPFTGLEGELNVTGRFAVTVALTNDQDLVSGMRYVKMADDAARHRLAPPRPPDTPDGSSVVSAISYAPAIDVTQLADDARR